jgi:hypothetical protein
MLHLLAQSTAPSSSGPSAATIFYLTLLFIFATAIVTTVFTKWARDKCVKFFTHYHVTLERNRGQTIWGQLKVFSSGVEVTYDHPYVDAHGRKKTSYMLYGAEMDQQLLSLFRYHAELSPEQQRSRQRQINRTFNPGPLKRLWRKIRNFVNTLRDAFNAAIGAVVTQYQRVNPGSALVSQSTSVTQLGQTLLGRFANAYEPLLEQYLGRPVILDVADPLDPNNQSVEYTGYLAAYTQQFIAVFNVEHKCGETITLTLPQEQSGAVLPPLPAPPAPGAPAPVLPPAMKIEHELHVRLDGLRFKIQNKRHEPVVVRRLEREGFEPVELGLVIPASAFLDLPARDAHGAKLIIDVVRCLDVVAPRRFASVRHAGELVDRKGFIDELHLAQLPLIPILFNATRDRDDSDAGAS